MKTATALCALSDTREAAHDLVRQLRRSLAAPDLIVVAGTDTQDFVYLHAHLRRTFPRARLIGASSYCGVVTEAGFAGGDTPALGALAIQDEATRFGVGEAYVEGSARDAGREATRRALVDASRGSELPSALFCIMPPGQEEDVLAGISEVAGDDIPLVGGCSGDAGHFGRWRQLSTEGTFGNAVVLLAIYAEGPVATAFHGPYDPTPHRGRITSGGDRLIETIDGRPAAVVYNDWTDGAIAGALPRGGYILGPSNLHPLGRALGVVEGVEVFCLSHPVRVRENGAISVYTDVAPGQEIVCMDGVVANVAAGAGRLARATLQTAAIASERLRAALLVFCAGCALTVSDDMDTVVTHLRGAMGAAPFLMLFTFGEQGHMVGRNRHGNLMTSALFLAEVG